MKKKIALIAAIIFAVLTFCGAGYIFYTGGEANPGYACIPMIFEFISVGIYRKMKKE